MKPQTLSQIRRRPAVAIAAVAIGFGLCLVPSQADEPVKRVDLGSDVEIELVYVPPGEFMMGSSALSALGLRDQKAGQRRARRVKRRKASHDWRGSSTGSGWGARKSASGNSGRFVEESWLRERRGEARRRDAVF